MLNYLPSRNLSLVPGCQCHVPDVLDLDFPLSEDSASPHDPLALSCEDTMLPSPSPSAFLWYISPAVCSWQPTLGHKRPGNGPDKPGYLAKTTSSESTSIRENAKGKSLEMCKKAYYVLQDSNTNKQVPKSY